MSTMTSIDAASIIDQVREAVSSSVTCGPEITKLLTHLLDPASSNTKLTQKSLTSRRHNAQDVSALPSTRRTYAPNTRIPKKPLRTDRETTTTLTILERLKLATEIVNRTLQALTSLVKSRSIEASHEGSFTALRRAVSSSRSLSAKAQASKPLQSRSINRPSPIPSEQTNCAREQTQNAVALAECARAALSTLRRNSSLGDGKSRLPPLQVELGMSALVSKLLALDMLDLAAKELHILARRLNMGPVEDGHGVQNITNNEDKTKKPASDDKPGLVEFLSFTRLPTQTPNISLVFTTQLQILRLLSMKTQAFDGETLLNALSSQNKSSPVFILSNLAEQDGRDKTARSFANLSQTVLDLSRRHKLHHQSKSNLGCNTKCCCFRLQLLSLECLRKGWELSGHKVSLAREVLSPLKTYVDDLAADDEVSVEQKLVVLSSAMVESDKTIFPLEATKRHELETLHLHVYETLMSLSSKLSELGQLMGKACDWVRSSLAIVEQISSSSARKCIVNCRAAILSMKHPDVEWKLGLRVLLKRIVSLLDTSVEGHSDDLDEMLSVVSSLRKLSINFIQVHHECNPAAKVTNQETFHLLYQLVMLSLDFLVRYLGQDHASQDSSMQSLFEARRTLASKVAEPNIENVLGIAKLDIVETRIPWKVTNRALQNCVRLAQLTGLETEAKHTSSSTGKSPSLRVRVSQIYWLKYLALKQEQNDEKTILDVLQKSVLLLADTSLKERTIGIIGTKLEKLGSAQEQCNQPDKARKAYAEAIAHYHALGLVDEAARESTKVSAELILSNDTYKLLRRAIEGYCRVAGYSNESRLDPLEQVTNSRVSNNQQGFLHEACLHHSIELRRNKSCFKGPTAAILQLWELIRQANDDDAVVRRLRALSKFLEASLNEGSFAPADLIQVESTSLLRETDPLTGNNTDSMGLIQYHKAVVGGWLTLNGKQGMLSTLDMSLRIWKQIVSKFNGNWPAFKERFPDASHLPRLLDLLANFLYSQNLDSDRAFVLYLSFAISLASSANTAAYFSTASTLATQLIRMGFDKDAEKVLQRCSQPIDCSEHAGLDRLDWHLTWAEYSISTEQPTRGSKHWKAARERFGAVVACEGSQFIKQPDALIRLARLHEINSKLAHAEKERAKALYHSRRASGLLFKALATLERREQRFKGTGPTSSFPKSSENTDSNSSDVSTSHYVGQGRSMSPAKLWCIGRYLFDCLRHLSALLSAEGILSEAHFYADQALKIAGRLESPLLQARGKIILGGMHIRSEQTTTGVQLLDEASVALDETFAQSEALHLRAMLTLARYCVPSIDNVEHMKSAIEMLNRIEPVSLFSPPTSSDEAGELTEQINRLNLTEKSGARNGRSGPKTNRSVSNVTGRGSAKASMLANGSTTSSTVIRSLYHEILQWQCWAHLQGNKLNEASVLLAEADSMLLGNDNNVVRQQLLQVMLLGKKSMKYLDTDPVLNLLSESTLAYPAAVRSVEQESDNPSSSQIATRTSQVKRKGRTPAATKSKAQTLDKASSDFTQSILETLGALAPLSEVVQRVSSVLVMHHTGYLMARNLLTASTACSGVNLLGVASTSIAYSIEIGRLNATAKELSAIAVEKYLGLEQGSVATDLEAEMALDAVNDIDVNSFQSKYIDIIPKQWTAVSLSVSEDCGDLRICRFRSGSSPFVISIPLNKQEIRDPQEENFGFNEAKAELRKIIDLANFSTHDAGDLSKKGAKTAWWDARAGLDSRLKDLLMNIENIWLGGFRAALKHALVRSDLLARFQQSFIRTLDRHLPSRRKGKAPKGIRVRLDQRVLELFTMLGNPSDLDDSDEPILDLLYFVVDVLQFNGERNAYDEIDFDPMVIEVQDALSHYHELSKSTDEPEPNGHVILILDKRLHSFPWESLPCLTGQSVSRLPSLGSLRDRILMMQAQEESTCSSFIVDRASGAYVLNPSSDLRHTQSTFEAPLFTLSGYSSTINQEPTEPDLKEILSSKALYLYFGHGSGGQYIRARTIRKLDQCAVSLLMGCSSGMLTEAGEYESYGTPINYLYAGAPAVVGTLWDVTDKDIDRFSMKMLEKWGLFSSGEEARAQDSGTIRSRSPVKKTARGGKGKARQKSKIREGEAVPDVSDGDGEKLTLDSAVAQARDACILRYLNGAAPVVYGIPVSLS